MLTPRVEQFATVRPQGRDLWGQLVTCLCGGPEFGLQSLQPFFGVRREERQHGDVGDLALNFPNLIPGGPNAFQQTVTRMLATGIVTGAV